MAGRPDSLFVIAGVSHAADHARVYSRTEATQRAYDAAHYTWRVRLRSNLVRRLREKRSTRLRVAGTLVLLCGIAGASLFYWTQTRVAVPELDDAAAGYTRAREHQMGQMMGTLGITMTQWMETLEEPGAEAIAIVAFAALAAALCFRVARLMDLPETDPAHWRSPGQ